MDPVSSRLLACLRRMLGIELEYAELPVAITGSFDTSIYGFRLADAPPDWSAPLILRLYRAEVPADRARFEAAVHGCVAARGILAPRVLLVADGESELGRPFIVMQRAAGRDLFAAILSASVVRVPGWLAQIQAQLHALDAGELERALAAAGFDPKQRRLEAELAECLRTIDELGLDGLRGGAEWLVSAQPATPGRDAICHGDFHPLNLLAEGGRVTGVIDWPATRIAEPEYDVGATVALIGQGPVDLPAALAPLVRAGRRLLVAAYLGSYRRRRPLDPLRLRYYEALRLLRFLIEAGELRLAERGLRARPTKRQPFSSAALQASIVARFRALTGVAIVLP